ncbi:LPS-assembly protein LptD [Chelativorans sp. Marseille-P2723]|uniref:LPS-assembly protein LptD n=1 Tax=Chelativorans sp. Marseille-P2723 TaxID=2709133 RepID=UPI0015701000|nr:LPS-assembly protein LptD [Chelativorans sp. Marseille-P2723]
MLAAVQGHGAAARLSRRLGLRVGVAALALCILTFASGAQDAGFGEFELPSNEQMLLTADTLVYDNDRNTISAVGGVQIDYAGNRLVAQRVTYDRATSRVIASGHVEIIERDGNRIYAERIDVTDDFSQGFVEALRVETVDETYFAAETAQRTGGRLTTFNRAVYTACEPCEKKPDSPPLWQIKARKIIWDGQAKTVRFENARFEMFGLPLAWIPFFEIADPTVKRKSGFLMPGIKGGSELGIGVTVPYYLALAPTYDLTVAVTGYTKQGFLAEAEWRQRFNNGQYTLQMAGIRQQQPDKWGVNTVDHYETYRGMIGSKGDFDINPRWSFGWDVLAQTDKNFSRTYRIEGFSGSVHHSQAYLTGLNDRNYFDLRAHHFQVQEKALNGRNDAQPWVLPSFDYAYTPDAPVAGGELNIDVNAQSLHREDGMYGTKLQGLEGNSGRMTAEAEWRRSFVTDGGLVVTPILHARGDAIYTDLTPEAVNRINSFTIDGDPVAADVRSAHYRSMATAGLEARWPVLFSAASSTHVLEPMAQIFARPNEPHHDRLGIPNEDAQSLVFDATTLFERDKFSGYDRIEGGTRANLGVRYTGTFPGGWTAHGLFGQSYHLAGVNSYAAPDLVNAGAYSGLEEDVSDFVGMIGFTAPRGISASASARFDEQTFEMRRAEVKAGGALGPVSANVQYAFIQNQPLYGFNEDRQEVSARASVRFNENWRGFASGTYDIQSHTLVRNAIGFAYDDECFTYLASFSQTRDRVTGEREQRFGFNISLRTLGDIGTNSLGPR